MDDWIPVEGQVGGSTWRGMLRVVDGRYAFHVAIVCSRSFDGLITSQSRTYATAKAAAAAAEKAAKRWISSRCNKHWIGRTWSWMVEELATLGRAPCNHTPLLSQVSERVDRPRPPVRATASR
jgi:hypothetical protein